MGSYLPRSARNNLGGSTAREREVNQYAIYGRNERAVEAPKGKTEYDILRENLRFIREDEDPAQVSYEERIARSYESKLFKEYALVDLKHYKSSRIALRWRTADEVVSGIGEDTCASLRCPYHSSSEYQDRGLEMPPLQAFELPFAYAEGGEQKSALVKVKVCERCARKLGYKKEGGERGKRGEDSGVEVVDRSRDKRRRERSSSPRRPIPQRTNRDRRNS